MRLYFRDPSGLHAAWRRPSSPVDPTGRPVPPLHSAIRCVWLLSLLAIRLVPIGLLPVGLLVWAQGAQALDIGEGPVLIFAQEVRLEPDQEVIVAEGNVEILRGERRLQADLVRYNQKTDQIEALGNISLLEPGGEVLYADRIVLSGDLRNGVAQQLRARLQDDSLLAAADGRRIDGTRTEMNKVVYSPCPVCRDSDDPPLWQLRASQVTHDQETRDITYHNAFLEIFGVPVAYTPYLTHPDPTVERRTGFLAPTVGHDSNLGFTVQTPYFFDLAPNYDLTVAPIFTTEENAVLTAQYRHLLESGRFELGGSATYATEAGTDANPNPKGQAFRGNLEGDGDFDLADRWDWGYELAVASDDTYLERYDFSGADVLENHLFARRIWGRNYGVVEGWGFQGLREEDDQGLIPIALPQAQLELTSEPMIWGSRFGLDSGALVLTRTDGLDTRRVSTGVSWELPKQGPIGDLYRLTLSARGDVYQTDGNTETFGSDGGNNAVGRFIPRATLDWSWPLLGEGFGVTHLIEPIVSGTWSTKGNNPDSIPNEDSQDFEFDDTNLFKPSRFPGIDRVEGGGKISYGMRYGLYGDRGAIASGLFGQLYKFANDPDIPEDTGLGGRGFSDYVGRIDLHVTRWLDVRYRFLLDQDSASLLRNEVGANFGLSWLRFDAQYLFLQDDPGDIAVGRREEFIGRVDLQATPWLAFQARGRRNIEDDRWIRYQFGVVYIHPCLELFAGVQRRFTDDRDADADTSIALRVEFKNLGAVGASQGL